jgi:hypothetical protein
MKSLPFLLALLLVIPTSASVLQASPNSGSSVAKTQSNTPILRYKMITGPKESFNDDLQLHFSKGWLPVGGVSVTVWNNVLYFAQLISHPADQ